MESKDTMGMPSPGSAAVISGSGPVSAAMATQRNVEVAPIAVTGTTSGGVQASKPDTTSTAAASVVTSPIVTMAFPHSYLTPPLPSGMATAIVPHSGATSLSGGLGIGRMDCAKRKRGRPRKYGPDGSVPLSVTPLASAPSSLSPSQKRGRGRPPGSGSKQQLAALGELMAGTAGANFTPHAITIAAGEDVAAKIMSFSHQGPRGICILSANGAISNVTLRQPAVSGGTVTYEGRFEILSLSGSFLLTESGGSRSRTGGLSVSLAAPDGRVVGGGVAGLLMAASPVQVVVGSFMSNTRKLQARPAKVDGSAGLSQISASGNPTNGHPAGRSSMHEMTDIKPAVAESPPLNQSTGAAASSNAESSQGEDIVIPIQSMGCSDSQIAAEDRPNMGIDISLPGG